MSETYLCPKCQAAFPPDEARARHYHCPNCSRSYLVVQFPAPGPVLAMRASATQADQVNAEASAPQAPNDSTTENNSARSTKIEGGPSSFVDEFATALATRRRRPSSNSSKPSQTTPPSDVPPSTTTSSQPPANLPSQAVVLVLPPPKNEKDSLTMEQLAGTFDRLPSPVSLEIAGKAGQRQLLIRGAPQSVKRVATELNSVYRQSHVEYLSPMEDPALGLGQPSCITVAAQLRPDGPEFLALKTWREFEGNDPLDALLGAFDGLQPGERALSQVVIYGAAPKGWADPHLQQLAALKRRGYGADTPAPMKSILGWTGGAASVLIMAILVMWAYAGPWSHWLITVPALIVLAPLAWWMFSLSRNPWAKVLEEDAAVKLREQAFQVELRLFASAGTEARAREILDQLIAAYQIFNTTSGNHLQAADLPPHINPLDLSPIRASKPALLNVKEIAGLWHMPVGESLELVERQTYERLLPLRQDVSHPDGAFVGVARKGEHETRVSLSPAALRRNVFIIGKTQHGKSTLMEHLAARWMRDPNRCVLIVDPHGDLAQRAIGLVPPERVNDMIYIDLSDETQSVGINLLNVADGSDPDTVAENFVDVGKALWQNYWGPRMLIPLGFGLRALAYANLSRPPERQYTLLALAGLLTCDAKIRDRFLFKEVSVEERPDIHQYFGEYARITPSQRDQVISPVLSKAHAFERSPAIRRLVGQPRSTVHLYEAIRSHKIIILNTNSGVLGDDLAGFIGSLFLNVMRRVITRQAMLRREERVQVSVIADEFQTMTGTDFGALLGELQKNGGNFVLGTQALDNVRRIDQSGALIGAIFAGVATTVALRVNGDDARYLAERELDVERLNPESLINLPPHHAYIKTIGDDGRTIPVYSLEIASPLTPDSKIVAAINARRSAYTLPAEKAERLSKLAGRMLREEHARTDSNPESTMGPESEAARRIMEGAVADSAHSVPEADLIVAHAVTAPSEAQRQIAVQAASRSKVPLPSFAAGKTGLVDEQESMFAGALRAVQANTSNRKEADDGTA